MMAAEATLVPQLSFIGSPLDPRLVRPCWREPRIIRVIRGTLSRDESVRVKKLLSKSTPTRIMPRGG